MSRTIITLLSDFGDLDTTVAVAKATLLNSVPDARIIDITHSVDQYDLRQASYMLMSAGMHYPKGTIHIAMVDIFGGEHCRLLMAQKDGFTYLAPDNGLLPLTFANEPFETWLCYQFERPVTFPIWIKKVAEVIATLKSTPSIPYVPYKITEAPVVRQPILLPDGMECNILHIDNYGNVVLDVTRDKFNEVTEGKRFRFKTLNLGDITRVSNNYNDVEHGQPLCRFNDAGFLEIAINHGNASSLLGLSSENVATLRYRTIKLFTQPLP